MKDEKMREEFEVWADGQGYNLERNELVFYEVGATRCAWAGWRESRAMMAVELPSTRTMLVSSEYDRGVREYGEAVKRAIKDAGIRVKE